MNSFLPSIHQLNKVDPVIWNVRTISLFKNKVLNIIIDPSADQQY